MLDLTNIYDKTSFSFSAVQRHDPSQGHRNIPRSSHLSPVLVEMAMRPEWYRDLRYLLICFLKVYARNRTAPGRFQLFFVFAQWGCHILRVLHPQQLETSKIYGNVTLWRDIIFWLSKQKLIWNIAGIGKNIKLIGYRLTKGIPENQVQYGEEAILMCVTLWISFNWHFFGYVQWQKEN